MTRERRLIRYWDRQAKGWASPAAERKYLAPSRAWVAARAVGPTLEVAIGNGANLAYYPPDLRLSGVDSSGRMVQAARSTAAALGRSLDLRVADAQCLPFSDEAFQTVVCTFSLCCIADERAGIGEMARVLKPGGRLLLADHVSPANLLLKVLFHLADLVSVPLLGEHNTRRPLLTVRAMGLEVVASERLHHGMIERVHARKA